MSLAGKQVPGPHYDLEEFQAQVQGRNFHVYKTRAVAIIRGIRQCGLAQAVEYARQAVLSLTPDDHAHTLKLPNRTDA